MTAAREHILVVDDERDMAESCAFFLERAGFAATAVFSGEEALKRIVKDDISVVITDLKMPRMSGLTLVEEIKKRDAEIELVVITGHPEVDSAVQAMRHGVLDYITKPFSEQVFLDRVEKALAHRRVRQNNEGLRERLATGTPGKRLIYRSQAFGDTVATLERAARTDASVLICGASGTGKELLAHHLHDKSPRADRPFVPLDCTTIAESLFESELFGHVKGSFSGADQNKLGLFHVADKGTLFFDEVGELPLAFQPKLLRAIQERQVRRVGAQKYDDVDVRIVCATNANLTEMVAAGTFRRDLYYRLDVVRIDVPPLGVRSEDVEALAEHFFTQIGGGVEVSAAVHAAMRAYDWPGNVRQLRNAVERACALGTGPRIELEDLPPEVREAAPELASESGGDEDLRGTFQEMKARKVAAIESAYVENLLRRHRGNVTRCAEDAGVSRSAFQKLMQRYGIKSSEFRD